MAVASPIKDDLDKSGLSTSRNSKQEPESVSETSSVHSGDASDRREVDIMTQAMSSKSEEYRLLFRLPPDEVLIQDFNCALQENILLQGHMYLFIHHICFYSNLFGFETKKTIPFHEVTWVRKAKTAAIFPTAIEIVAGEKKHFFGSFLSRDEAYRLIMDGWAQHNAEAKALMDLLESKSDTGHDNAIVALERVPDYPQLIDSISPIDRSKDVNMSEDFSSISNGQNCTEGSEKSLECQETEKEESAECSSSGEPLSWKIEDIDAPKIPEYFALVIEAKFPVSVEEFFNLFISDRASDFLENFHKGCGDKGFQCTPWRQHKQFGHARDLSFQHPVKVYIGAKLGRCQELQKFHVYRNSHLVIETSQQISEVPFADYFHVERIWDVENNSNEENCCTLRVYFNVAFSKKTMFKGKIEQSTRDELREVHVLWINSAHELLKQKNAQKLKGQAGPNTDMILDDERGVGSSSKLEGPREEDTTVTPSGEPQINKPVESNHGEALPMASFIKETWTTLVSYSKSQRHFPLYLLVALVFTLMIMQISIIVLLTRVPEVRIVTHGNQISSTSSYRLETIEWLEKRTGYLKGEMFMVETQLERMRHEYASLKDHLESLQSLKPMSG